MGQTKEPCKITDLIDWIKNDLEDHYIWDDWDQGWAAAMRAVLEKFDKLS